MKFSNGNLHTRSINLTSVRVFNIEVKTVDDGRGACTISAWERVEGTRAGPGRVCRAERRPQEVCKALSIGASREGVTIASATEGQEHLLSLGLAVLDILRHSGAAAQEMVVGWVIDTVVARGRVYLATAGACEVGSRPTVPLRWEEIDEAEWDVIEIGRLTVAAKVSASLALSRHQYLHSDANTPNARLTQYADTAVLAEPALATVARAATAAKVLVKPMIAI